MRIAIASGSAGVPVTLAIGIHHITNLTGFFLANCNTDSGLELCTAHTHKCWLNRPRTVSCSGHSMRDLQCARQDDCERDSRCKLYSSQL